MELIDVNQYFAESRKAIQVTIEKERSLYKELTRKDKLDLLRKRKKETNSIEEYEKIEELEKQLEKEIKFGKQPVLLVPDEYKEVIKKNVAVEEKELNKKLLELRNDLKKQVPYLKDVLLPLLLNIHEIDKLKCVPTQIDAILRSTFNDQQGFLTAEYLVNNISRKRKSKLVEETQEVIGLIETIVTKGELK
ncbi:hypothetical protein [Niallia taxi]|uniref:Uncharacterized protein n=1 Tax=Niallia taxi TaxID=2499688 RepID=A0A437K2V2_9BACI|nr:hypothetical protein [Niallia taxi]RVT56429.1 hypothetical protein EM808_27460 [Niallia taxi]